MTLPYLLSYGGFIDSNIVSAQLTRQRGVLRDEYEQMVLGQWEWSSDGRNLDHLLVFKEDHSCVIKDLGGKPVRFYKEKCSWKILMKSL